MLHKDAYIDLPGYKLPFNHSDILTEQDYEILENKIQPSEPINTKNLVWVSTSYTNTNASNRKVSLMAYISNKDVLNSLAEYLEQNFKKDIIGLHPWGHYSKVLAVSLITFSNNTPWHREGFNADWTSKHFEDQYNRRYPYQRFNYAINFPFYVKDAHRTKVEFAKTKRPIQDIENKLIVDMMRNSSSTEMQKGITVSTSLDQIIDTDRWKEHIDVFSVKQGYDCPYIINLSSYHKVTTSNATRLSLRLMGSAKYNWQNIEDFYNNNELLLNA